MKVYLKSGQVANLGKIQHIIFTTHDLIEECGNITDILDRIADTNKYIEFIGYTRLVTTTDQVIGIEV